MKGCFDDRLGQLLTSSHQDERHSYEKCQYKEFQRRLKELK